MSEEWLPIPGTKHEASDQGRIRHLERRIPLVPAISTSGYYLVHIYVGEKPKHQYVHRLVALAFLGPCPDGKQVNHIDGNKLNNRVENLEYLTPIEHEFHTRHIAKLNSGLGEDNPRAVLTADDVRRIRKQYAEGNISQERLGKLFGVTQGAIYLIVTRKNWRHVE